VQQVSGKYINSYVQAGESLGIISPDSSLLAECYVSPYEVGLLKTNMKAKFQIDAFNYTEWGLIEGQILDISKDVLMMDNKPVFRVKCVMNNHQLRLKNGYVAQLKKGLNLRARFVVANRSLYQLLYDQVNDWLNPNL
jgi:membrane fusion protein, peptide pheromone/bacteriocin exporter